MNFNFKEIAQNTTELCRLMAGREKLTTDDVVNKDFTIIAFDFAPKFDEEGNRVADPSTGEQEVFGVVAFAEKPDSYYSVGTVFTKVCKAWAEAFDNDPVEASKELAKQGGVKVRFKDGKTKRGRNVVTVEIL